MGRTESVLKPFLGSVVNGTSYERFQIDPKGGVCWYQAIGDDATGKARLTSVTDPRLRTMPQAILKGAFGALVYEPSRKRRLRCRLRSIIG